MFQRLKEFAIDYSPYHFSHTSRDFQNLPDQPEAIRSRTSALEWELQSYTWLAYSVMGLTTWALGKESALGTTCGLFYWVIAHFAPLMAFTKTIDSALESRTFAQMSPEFLKAVNRHTIKKDLTGIFLAMASVGIGFATEGMCS